MYILVYMQLIQTTQDWGNSTGVRIPKKALQAAKWANKQDVYVKVDGDSIIFTPVKQAKEKTLDELLEGVTPDNTHPPVAWGPDVGKEIIDD